MKKNLIIILFALICGVVVTAFIFLKLSNNLKEDNMITVFQVGVYKNEINALSEANKYNGIVHKEDGYFRVYIAAYQNNEIINKMKGYYDEIGTSYYLRKIKTDEEFLTTISKYEKLLQNSNDKSIYQNLNSLLISKLGEHI